MTTCLHLISCLSQVPTSNPSQRSKQRQQTKKSLTLSAINRRRIIFLLSLFNLSKATAAIAFGIPGPKEWLKEQKKKASRFLLAPIYASRNSLRNASVLLRTATTPDSSTKDLGEEFQGLLRTAARDCVVEDRNSFVAFQAKTGVEVCTFSLIVKNASSLLEDKNPIKVEAEDNLADLIRSFTFLNDVLYNIDLQLASDRQKVEDMLKDTVTSLDKFEQGILKCLDV